MMLTPSLILFWFSLMFSILFMLSSSSYFMAWLALELNTMAFIPFILTSRNDSGEAALKYFLSQTLGSIIFIYSLIGLTFYSTSLTQVLYASALFVKLGAAPLHAWLPGMVSSLSWEVLFMLLTIQKFNPLILLSYGSQSYFFLLIGGVSLIVGAMMGLIQTQVRKILTYSSINQVGWMILALWMAWKLMLIFYFMYIILLLPVISLVKLCNLNVLKQFISSKINLTSQIIFFLNLLSLGGLPPFLGFLPKWLILNQFVFNEQLCLALIMVLTSLLTLFYYLRLTYNSFLMNTNSWNFLKLSIPSHLILLTQLNLLSLWVVNLI